MCRECKRPYYITTAIAYTSGKPHIGNTYEIVLADSIARYRRAQGYDVFFQTGTDEHGQKIELKAQAEGISPKAYVDKVAGQVKDVWDLMNTSYDKFIRTTDEDHEAQVQKIFKKLYDQGDIYKGYYEGLYCTPCESFFTESQLMDGKCPDCGGPVQPAKEEAYFFKMSKYADRLISHINEHPEFIQPVSRKNEMMNNFLLPGLQDLCVSRTSFTWVTDTLAGLQAGSSGFDLSKIIVKLNMAYLYIRKGADPKDNVLEYAFQLQVITEGLIPKEIAQIVDVSNLSLSVWNTSRKKVVDKMQLITADEYLDAPAEIVEQKEEG